MRKLVKRIKDWYEAGNWTHEQVVLVLQKEKISAEEYTFITGEEYSEEVQGEA